MRDYEGTCTDLDGRRKRSTSAPGFGGRNGLARVSVRKRDVLILLVPTGAKPNYAPDLFFHEPFIPQLRDCHTSRRGVEGWLGQGHELMRVFFVAEDECEKEPVPHVLKMHDAMLATWAQPRNGPSVPVLVTYVQSFFVLWHAWHGP